MRRDRELERTHRQQDPTKFHGVSMVPNECAVVRRLSEDCKSGV
jgi:hypothetical protein